MGFTSANMPSTDKEKVPENDNDRIIINKNSNHYFHSYSEKNGAELQINHGPGHDFLSDPDKHGWLPYLGE